MRILIQILIMHYLEESYGSFQDLGKFKMEIELQKINNIVIISNDTVIGNESALMKKVSPRRLNLLSNSEIVCRKNFGIGSNLGPSRFFQFGNFSTQ